MSDLISRQAAIDAMFADMPGLMFNDVLKILRTLPSAQPERKAGRWIPVTERLPEVDENVLISYHYDEESEFFPPFDGVTISYWTGVKNHNIPHFADIGDACTVLAWMPLPEPYREEDDGRG